MTILRVITGDYGDGVYVLRPESRVSVNLNPEGEGQGSYGRAGPSVGWRWGLFHSRIVRRAIQQAQLLGRRRFFD